MTIEQCTAMAYDCVVCFEAVCEKTSLPCACNVAYCIRCWDRALAQSFHSCGQARCPTCRLPVQVDFDAERGCLVFSKESSPFHLADCRGMDSEEERRAIDSRTRATAKLREQALPAQVRLLEVHGASNPALAAIAHCPEENLVMAPEETLKRYIKAFGGSFDDCESKQGLVCRLLEVAESTLSLAPLLGDSMATACVSPPSCVCGSALERVSGAERARRCCEKLVPGSPPGSVAFESTLARLTMSGTAICFCDLCTSFVPINDAVWTCKNGDSTILHATSYDVCDRCFMRYVCKMEEPSLKETKRDTMTTMASDTMTTMASDTMSD
eukprot:TRINITY_DN4105_c0_g1_i1.p1 TRINITY_DN4105_c0_g1~~TRINITY_DN4105_c0_g1_i1.p1  ORF type:complete len:327 (-),score=62.89 TRINITY_DN4105_c0_g1_i1:202-1182(-)